MKSKGSSVERWLEGHEKLLLTGLFLVASAARLIHFLAIRGNPFEQDLFLDAAFYDRWAVRIAGGDILGEGPFFMGPLYPYFLALVYSALGHSYNAIRWIQHGLGIVNCFLIYFIARRAAGRRVAILAGLLGAVYGVFLYYESQILIASLQTFYLTLFALLYLRAASNGRLRWWFLAGMVLGFSTLTRGNVLLLAPLAAATPFFPVPAESRWRRPCLLFLFALLLVIFPVTLRNYYLGGDPVLITANSGFNFYIGNNALATGTWVELPGVDLEMGDQGRHFAERETGRSLQPSEVSGFWKTRALDFIREHPRQEARLLVKKIYLFWTGWEIPQMHNNFYFFRDHYAPHLKFPLLPTFFILGPFALYGMARGIGRSSGMRLISLVILVYMLSVTLFFVTSRYRNPIASLIIIAAAYGCVTVMEDLFEKRVVLVFFSILLIFLLFRSLSRPVITTGYSGSYTSLGVIHTRNGRYPEAVMQFRKALEIRPDYDRARVNLAFALVQMGAYDEAKVECMHQLDRDPQNAMAYNTLGLILRHLGDDTGALENFRKAIECNPWLWQAHFNLALFFRERSMFEEAMTCFEKVLETDPDNVKALNNLASLYTGMGRLAEARELLERCIRLEPRNATCRENLERLERLPGQ